MKKIVSTGTIILGLAIAVNCVATSDDGHRIDVTERNDLGVTTIETTRIQDHGNTVFTLRALSANDKELASVQLTTGVIADLPQLLPGDDVGSELLISVAGSDRRMVSHETQQFHIPATDSSDTNAFLQLTAVTSVLAGQANVIVAKASTDDTEAPFTNFGCSPGYLLTSPLAQQCCYTSDTTYGLYTIFVRPSDAMIIQRYRNPSGTACKAADGVSSCSGSACYFGPFGFSRASTWRDGAHPVIAPFINGMQAGKGERGNYCLEVASGTAQFSNVTGTNPPGQGCPASNGGGIQGSGAWDY